MKVTVLNHEKQDVHISQERGLRSKKGTTYSKGELGSTKCELGCCLIIYKDSWYMN